MVMKIQILVKSDDFAEIPWRAISAHKLIFHRVSDPKILCGIALRAIFKISPAPLLCGDLVALGRRFWPIFWLENFTFLVRTQDLNHGKRFPFVQSEINV